MQLNIIVDDGLMRQVQQANPQRSEQELIEAALKVWLALHAKHTQKSEVPPSCYDLAKHLLGTLQAPPDLSTNKGYFEGFGK